MTHITDEEKSILEQQRIEKIKREAFIDGMRYQKSLQKELSDEEIQEIADSVCYLIDKDKKDRLKGSMYIEDFARAIIKASRGKE